MELTALSIPMSHFYDVTKILHDLKRIRRQFYMVKIPFLVRVPVLIYMFVSYYITN